MQQNVKIYKQLLINLNNLSNLQYVFMFNNDSDSTC